MNYQKVITRRMFDVLPSENRYWGQNVHLETLERAIIKCTNPSIIVSPECVLQIGRLYECGNRDYERRVIHLLKHPESNSSYEYNRLDLKEKVLWFYGLKIPVIIVNDLEDECIFGVLGDGKDDTYLFGVFY